MRRAAAKTARRPEQPFRRRLKGEAPAAADRRHLLNRGRQKGKPHFSPHLAAASAAETGKKSGNAGKALVAREVGPASPAATGARARPSGPL
jgi:hypothetical protein